MKTTPLTGPPQLRPDQSLDLGPPQFERRLALIEILEPVVHRGDAADCAALVLQHPVGDVWAIPSPAIPVFTVRRRSCGVQCGTARPSLTAIAASSFFWAAHFVIPINLALVIRGPFVLPPAWDSADGCGDLGRLSVPISGCTRCAYHRGRESAAGLVGEGSATTRSAGPETYSRHCGHAFKKVSGARGLGALPSD